MVARASCAKGALKSAKLRGSAEGTIKTHLNAIYRKSGVTGRAQLVSILIEDLMRGTLVGTEGQKSA